MLFDVEKVTDKCTDAIEGAIRSVDPTAQVTVNVPDQRVRIEGLLTEGQAISTLQGIGYSASTAAPHSGEGSECCGGCS
ncbi:hypothetical protein [Lysobacter sp. A3-1-A15]|uniref:hypothetical protein n=1 Tax=Novilysobacter viscosus TaxID=3098602 RepID=UPI002ED8D076